MARSHVSLDEVANGIYNAREYVCGPVHCDSHHPVPKHNMSFVCDLCGWIHPNSGILGDIQYLVMALVCARLEGQYRYMTEHYLSEMSVMEIENLLIHGICVESDMISVDRHIWSIQQQLDRNEDAFRRLASPVPEISLYQYVCMSVDNAIVNRNTLISGYTEISVLVPKNVLRIREN